MHGDGTLARHFHSTAKTPEMAGVNLAAVLEGQKAAGTKPLPHLNRRLEAARDLVIESLPSRAWQIAEIAPNRPTAGCTHTFGGYFTYGAEIFIFVSKYRRKC